MPVINQIMTLDQAITRKMATWEVMLGAVGRAGDNLTYPNLFMVPPSRSLPSVAGIAIGPRSQIDRCWVFWDPQVVINAQLDTPGIDFCRRLTRESPLLYTQYGKKNIPNPATLAGPSTALRILADPVLATGNGTKVDDCGVLTVPDTFFPESSIVETAFSILDSTQGQPEANQPYLHLVFYLKPAVQAPGTIRMPLEINATVQLSGPGGSPVAPIPVFAGAIPVHGRKHVSVQAYAPFTSADVFDVRVGGLQPGLALEGPQGDIPKEFTINDSVLVNCSATNAPRLEIENPNCDYITIWATRDSGGGGVGRVSVKATD